ncbi:hypothetical protein [Amycolatopsis sp. NPDC051071]|uniref:hypothetical protein n=1 Tax=Amycolatopsis sp. NPDC051071 TaxID=3154637 RepID=UPI00343F01C8
MINPLPSYVWYQDMADFAEGISDERAGRRLERAIRGKGAFRHFKDELHEEYPELLPSGTRSMTTARIVARCSGLPTSPFVDHDTIDRFAVEHPDPDLP